MTFMFNNPERELSKTKKRKPFHKSALTRKREATHTNTQGSNTFQSVYLNGILFFCSIGLAGQAHVFLLVLEKHNNPSVLQSFLPLQEFLASYLNMVTFLCKKKACSHALQVCCGQCKKERKKEKAYWMSVYTCQGKDRRSGKQGVEMRSREMQNSIKTVKMCRAQ